MTDTTGEGVNEIYAIESTNIGWRSLSGLLKIAKVCCLLLSLSTFQPFEIILCLGGS